MTPGRAYGDSHRRMATFAFSLGGTGPEAGGGWSFWGRGDTRRFEAGLDGTSHDGTLTGLHLGADLRAGKWLAGVSVMRSAADATTGSNGRWSPAAVAGRVRVCWRRT